MLTSADLLKFIESNGIDAEIVTLEVHTPTVESAAEAVGVDPNRIIKTLLFLVDDEPVVAISCGTDPIDRKKLAKYFEVGRKRVKLAGANRVLEETGYAVGAVPPIGGHKRLQTFLDPRVLKYEEVYAGGGAINALLRISPADIFRLSSAVELNLV